MQRHIYCVFLRQNPTLFMHSDMVFSSASVMASIVMLPPRATRSFATAASVTSSFVWDESMREINVESLWAFSIYRKFLFQPQQTKKGCAVCTFGSISRSCALSQPMVSTERNSFLPHFLYEIVRSLPSFLGRGAGYLAPFLWVWVSSARVSTMKHRLFALCFFSGTQKTSMLREWYLRCRLRRAPV